MKTHLAPEIPSAISSAFSGGIILSSLPVTARTGESISWSRRLTLNLLKAFIWPFAPSGAMHEAFSDYIAATMTERIETLRQGPYAGRRTPETKVMNYLLRQLSGGCQ